MKHKSIIGLACVLLAGTSLGLISCGGNSQSSTPNTDTSEPGPQDAVIIKKLKVKSLPDKLDYATGEKFSSKGLKIVLSTSKNGFEVGEVETSDYTLSIPDGTILKEGSHEVIVKSNDLDVRSTSFTIRAEVKEQLTPLKDVVAQLIKTNNYTVNSDMGSGNIVKGLVTENALIWNSTEEAYFSDNGFGYGTYNNKTFRYRVIDKQISNATYIEDLGGDAYDGGLWSADTVDDLAERRISNYNIKGMTAVEKDYVENLKSLSNNPNRYQIEPVYSKWLFNTIAHTQLTINPAYFLDKGSNSGKIFVEVKKDGLHVELIAGNSFDGIRNCNAVISNIGTTEIPGMASFMANPHFVEKVSSVAILEKLIKANNYTLTSSDENKAITYTPNYIYGSYLENYNGENLTALKLESGNKLGKPEGYYNVSIDGESNVTVGNGIDEANLIYLSKYNIFSNAKTFFTESGYNSYMYIVNDDQRPLTGIDEFASLFIKNTAQIDSIKLDVAPMGNTLYQVIYEFSSNGMALFSVTIESFGQASVEPLDNYISNNL